MLSLRKIAFLAFCTTPSFVSAHITPTVPTSGAQYEGGQTQIFKWFYNKEDVNGNPFVAERFKCDLMWGDNHWVALLARNLSIYDEWVAVHFRPDYGFDSTAYYVRYMMEGSNSVVNTDRFTLTHMNGTNFSRMFNEQPDPNVVSHGSGGFPPTMDGLTGTSASVAQATPSSSYVTSGQTARLTQAGNAPSPTGTRSVPANSASDSTNEANQSVSQAGPIGPLGTPPTPSLDDTGDSEPTSRGSQSGAVSLTRQRESAWQKISLALWPVLVGAMMAL
ncbi:hypothetical protein FRC11_010721 [Ceratobasidium sp. 423]|nr:hypothetical protein FRC11_010721 [Ceratobasidium sp. 423]